MSKLLTDIKLGLDEVLEEKLKLLSPGYTSFRLLRKSVDARGKRPHFIVSLEVYGQGEVPKKEIYEVEKVKSPFKSEPIIIVGAGPAGLFAALRLCERGIPSILLERGSEASPRMKKIAEYWRYGKLDPNNNVCFGEGGAGLYSDGKLITRIKSPYIPYVLNRLVQFGAPEEIEYVSNPHVGSDKIRKVIPPMRNWLKANGCEVHFNSKVKALDYKGTTVTGVILEDGKKILGSSVVLATGHSASDIMYHLHENDVEMEGKSFAVGLRIEHPQKTIDCIQYGDFAGHKALGSANYKLTDHDHKTGIGVYSFCMCPGGYVIASSTEEDGIVSNGMSNYARNSPFANAAVVVSIDHDKRFGRNIFAGMEFRREMEIKAKLAVIKAGGAKEFPAQSVNDFLEGKLGKLLPGSSPSGQIAVRLDQLLPQDLVGSLKRSFQSFSRKMPGFISNETQLYGVETRTSCPIRVVRDEETLQSKSHKNLYPTGEGAGYAGGITSAAVDGVRVAEAIVRNYI